MDDLCELFENQSLEDKAVKKVYEPEFDFIGCTNIKDPVKAGNQIQEFMHKTAAAFCNRSVSFPYSKVPDHIRENMIKLGRQVELTMMEGTIRMIKDQRK